MSEPINVEARVDELSKPENQAELESIITGQFNDAINPAGSKPADGDKAPEQKPAEPGDNPKPAEDTPPADKGEPSKPGEKKAGEEANKGDRVKQLLTDRNVAENKAAETLTENQILSKQVETLTALVEKLTSGKGGEGDGTKPEGDDPSADDKPMTKKEVDEYLERKLNEKNQSSEKEKAAEKSITDQIQALDTNEATPNAKEYAEDLKAIMAKHPTLSAYAAYRMLQGEGIIPTEDIGQSNANRTGTGNRSKSNLLKNKKPEDMSQAELEAHLKAEERSGGLQGLI